MSLSLSLSLCHCVSLCVTVCHLCVTRVLQLVDMFHCMCVLQVVSLCVTKCHYNMSLVCCSCGHACHCAYVTYVLQFVSLCITCLSPICLCVAGGVDVYVIDTVSGRIIHHMQHKLSSSPVHMVLSEHWLLVGWGLCVCACIKCVCMCACVCGVCVAVLGGGGGRKMSLLSLAILLKVSTVHQTIRNFTTSPYT